MVVAQLVERSLPTPEIRGLNPDIGKILSTNCTIEKTKIKKKRLGMAHLSKKVVFIATYKNAADVTQIGKRASSKELFITTLFFKIEN